MIQSNVLIAGRASGPIRKLQQPISFWGGVDPTTGRVIDPRHPDCGIDIHGTMLVLPSTIGSSSSSAVMLELIRRGTAPAALILGRVDAILTLGVIVARELGYPSIPVVELGTPDLAMLPDGGSLTITEDGTIEPR